MIFLNLKLFYNKDLNDQEKVLLGTLICTKKDLESHFSIARNYNFLAKKDSRIFFQIKATVMRENLGWSKTKFYRILESLINKGKIIRDSELQMYAVT